MVGIASYTKDLAPLEKIMRDAMMFPLYDGGNQGVRRRQLHDILRHPVTTRCWPPAEKGYPRTSEANRGAARHDPRTD